jgi:ATP-dependent Clp protease ATP-binding subunit ClpA
MCQQAVVPHSVVEGRFQAHRDAREEDAMSKPAPLDPTRTGRQAQDLDHKLRDLVVGQEEATQAIIRAYQSHVAGLSPAGRPIGNFLFLGPTGSGKPRIVEATAQSLPGDSAAVVKIDCAEFQHSHEIAELIGSPPGYLGHRETLPLLSQEALNKHHTDKLKLSIVLFDEIEKASDALWSLLLGAMDKGVLTLGNNRKVDFSSATVFMTSNLGARDISALAGPRLGFHSPADEGAGCCGELDTKRSSAAVEAARRKFTPEFMNRLDCIVVCKALTGDDRRRIVDIELDTLQQRIRTAASGVPFGLSVARSARELLLEKGTDATHGARPLKRAIQRMPVQPLANLVASGQIRRGDCIGVSRPGDSASLAFYREARGIDAWKTTGAVAA